MKLKINKPKTYEVVDEKGKVIESFRLKSTAFNFIGRKKNLEIRKNVSK